MDGRRRAVSRENIAALINSDFPYRFMVHRKLWVVSCRICGFSEALIKCGSRNRVEGIHV